MFFSQIVFGQKYFTRTGSTAFKASVDAFEPVAAINNSTTVVLNTENGEIASLLLIKGFRFRVALMQEHFNENYMDSNEYPKATFKGKIHNFDIQQVDANKAYKINGTLTVKGKDKLIETFGHISKHKDKLLLTANFSVSPNDFSITIPSIVRKKIAKQIDVNLQYELFEKK